MLLRLDVDTHAYHRGSDRPWVQLMVSGISRAAYAEQLARVYAFEAPFEAAFAYTPQVLTLVGMRTRTQLLARDLSALNYPLAQLTQRIIAPFPGVAEALGWLYAIERSKRLLGKAKRNISERLPDAPTAYIDDPDASVRWRELETVLEAVAQPPRVADRILHAAHDAFRCLLDWYVSEQPLRRGA